MRCYQINLDQQKPLFRIVLNNKHLAQCVDFVDVAQNTPRAERVQMI